MFNHIMTPVDLAHIDRLDRALTAAADVAKAYGAVCTPDFFGYNKDLQLQYRGRLDASGKQAASPEVRRDLFEAMCQVAETGHGPAEQIASIGCSIKWREALG